VTVFSLVRQMRLGLLLAVAIVAAVGVLAGLPSLARSADPGMMVVGAGLVLGLLSALGPRPRRPDPIASGALRRAVR
jgi:hypothetical protein